MLKGNGDTKITKKITDNQRLGLDVRCRYLLHTRINIEAKSKRESFTRHRPSQVQMIDGHETVRILYRVL